MSVQAEAEKLYESACVKLFTKKQAMFISTILYAHKVEFTDAIDTACTDGRTMLISPTFFTKLNAEERVFLIAHECWHPALDHLTRRGERDPQMWNAACDYFINDLLISNGYIMPKGGLHDTQYKDMTADQIYEKLKQKQDKNPGAKTPQCVIGQDIKEPTKESEGMSKPDSGNDGNSGKGNSPANDENGNGMSPAESLEAHMARVLQKALMTHDMYGGTSAGNIPGSIRTKIKDLFEPKLPWYSILRNYMDAFIKDDYSYRRPNKRFYPDVYLPTLCGEGIEEIAWAFDISGSVTDDQIKRFNSEVAHVQEALNPRKTTIVSFDTRIHDEFEFNEDEELGGLEFTGRGGTCLKCVFKYFRKRNPKVLIVFSDLECSSITEKPPYPVVWICIGNPTAKVNFGKLIHIDN